MSEEQIIYAYIARKHETLIPFFPKEMLNQIDTLLEDNKIGKNIIDLELSPDGFSKLLDIQSSLREKSMNKHKQDENMKTEVLASLMGIEENKTYLELIELLHTLPPKKLLIVLEKFAKFIKQQSNP